MTGDIIQWLSLVIFFPGTPISDLPCCLQAGSATRGGAPQSRPAPHSSPVWAGIASGWWCSSGSSGLGDEGATPWSSPSGSSQFYGERDGECVSSGVGLKPDRPTWRSVYSPVLKLCCSCFVCAPIYQLLRLKESRFRRKYKNYHRTHNKIIQKCWTLTCMLDSPGWEKDREKNGFHKLAFVMSKLIVIGDVYSWMLNHT